MLTRIRRFWSDLRLRLSKLREHNALQRYIARKLFAPAQALGFHITGDHFYEPIPNTKLIERNYPEGERACVGIDLRFDAAERLALELVDTVIDDYPTDVGRFGYGEQNYFFRGLDALLLYGFLRHFKPTTIAEAGQGFTTRVAAAAIWANLRNGDRRQMLVSIDPYPRLHEEPAFADIDMELERNPFQQVVPRVLEAIGPGDLLFIDSSHCFKFGSDVEVLFEEVLPNLPVGAYVHIHDIWTPFYFPKEFLVKQKRFWNEQYMLEAFLRFNDRYEVVLPAQYLQRRSQKLNDFLDARVRPKIPEFHEDPASFYIKRVA